jgi:hypothetical protein
MTLTWSRCALYEFNNAHRSAHLDKWFYLISNESRKNEKACKSMIYRLFEYSLWSKSDLAGARTQDPLLKREMLYQLSYQVNKFATPIFVLRVQI